MPIATSLPKLSEDNGKALMGAIRTHLNSCGLVRDASNGLNGAECTGWTDAFGSTGFSVRGKSTLMVDHQKYDDDVLVFHIVVSGKTCGLDFRRIPIDTGDDTPDWGHEPTNPSALHPKIKNAFTTLGFDVLGVQDSGYQMMWDDDVEYNVIVRRPAELGPDPIAPTRRGWY